MDEASPREAARLLHARLGDTVRVDEPLGPYTTLRVGGPAAALARVESQQALAEVAEVCQTFGLPALVIGRGSNLLVPDRGWPGVALILGRAFRGVDLMGEHATAGAAEPMPALARVAARGGLSGLAFGVAIPGTLGGAVRMNAGAHGGAIGDVLEWAEVARLDAGARVERWEVPRLAPSYRHTELPPDAVVLRARMRLRRADAAVLGAEMDEMRKWRREHQPINEPSCGSVFRNPPGDSAGRLIEAAGLKGRRVGGARISAVHGNFITVSQGAEARHVYELIRLAQRVILEAFGIELATEVVLAGWREPDVGDDRHRTEVER